MAINGLTFETQTLRIGCFIRSFIILIYAALGPLLCIQLSVLNPSLHVPIGAHAGLCGKYSYVSLSLTTDWEFLEDEEQNLFA